MCFYICQNYLVHLRDWCSRATTKGLQGHTNTWMITSWSIVWKCSVTRSRLDAFPITCGISQSFSWLASYWSSFVSLWWKWICLSPRVLDVSLKSVVAVLCNEIFLDSLLQWQNGIEWDEVKSGDSLEFLINNDHFGILAPTSPLKNVSLKITHVTF